MSHFDKTRPAGYDEHTMITYLRFLRSRCHLNGVMAGLILILISATLLGCQSSIEVVTPAVAPTILAVTAVPQAHAVAIIGVDFDPELDYDQIISNGGVTLLVAVENQGQVTETGVELKARLLDTANEGSSRDLLNETVLVDSLAPREVRIVRFNQVSDLPVRERYKLVAELTPVQGERELSDNTRSFDILVHNSN